MVTEVIYEIGIGHRRPGFDTINDWESATQIDCVSSGVIIVGELIENKVYDEDSITFTGATVDATRYRVLRASPHIRHNGTFGSGPVIKSDVGGSAAVINFGENYARLEDVELDGGDAVMYAVYGNASFSGYQSNDVLAHGAYYGGFAYFASGTMDNCVAHNCGMTDFVFGPFAGPSAKPNECRARHCVAFRNNDGDAEIGTTAFRYLVVQNVAAFNYGNTAGHADYLNLGVGSIKYASSDSTGSEASLTGLDPDTIFVSLASGAGNFLLASGTTVLNSAGSGTNLTADIKEESRDVTSPDIGVGEWHDPQATVHLYPSDVRDNLPMSGEYDLSGGVMQLPFSDSTPEPQTRAFGDVNVDLDGQIIMVSTSGLLMVSSGTQWAGLEL
jgi:hypothetical protein